MSKPPRTATAHPLSFEKLSPLDFERLCLWLVLREGFERAEHLGESGGEGGRDVVAWRAGRRFVFQCKRVQSFGAADARKEIEKLRRLPVADQPHELVFVVSRAVSANVRSAARAAWGDETTCHFWAGTELDERVNRHPDLRATFFQLPPVGPAPFRHNLPFSSLGPLFHGRETILAQLHETLTRTRAGRATAIAGKAVHGLGGVGKTRLAIEYAWQHATEYSALLFVGAGSAADLRRNLAALAEPGVLDLPKLAALKEEARVEAVLHRLGEQPGWLLILDNVDSEDAAAAVDTLVARLHGGHVLLTGRLAQWSAEVEAIPLDLLTEAAAVSFLLARTENRRRATPEDTADATALARELGYLPLALEQAGAAIAHRRLTLAGYLEDWKTRRDQVLTWFDPRVSHYPVSLAVTWQTSVDRLSTPARRLLERLAWLGPEPIPESLLDVPVPALPGEESILDPRDSLVELDRYSLVTRAAETPTFTVHRLVQDVTRRSLRNDLGHDSLTEALAWIDTAFEGDPQDVRTWPVLDVLAPHARAVTSFADTAGITAHTPRLMSNVATLLFTKALQAEAEPLIRRALAINEKSFGTEHPEVATALNNLAQLLQATNRVAEAESLMWRALAIDEKWHGPEHADVARDLNNLAWMLKDTHRLTEAESLMARVVTIFENSFGENHANVATALNNLARLLQDTNRLSEAEPLMRRALAIDEKNFGKEHPNVARDLNNLARMLQDMNRLAEAAPLMTRVAPIFENSLGENHPHVAAALNNLAVLLQASNRPGEAEPLMRRALAILLDFERSTGYEHPNRQRFSGNYRALLKVMDKSAAEIEEALAGLVRASE